MSDILNQIEVYGGLVADLLLWEIVIHNTTKYWYSLIESQTLSIKHGQSSFEKAQLTVSETKKHQKYTILMCERQSFKHKTHNSLLGYPDPEHFLSHLRKNDRIMQK